MVSETFLHAWRRRAELPAEPLPWLLVTARHTIHNRTRGQRRAESLWQQAVSEYWRTPAPLPPDEAVAERDAMIAALAACSPAEREALLLIAWDGLTYADAAAVLGCSERALTVRVSRSAPRRGRRWLAVAAAAAGALAIGPAILSPTSTSASVDQGATSFAPSVVAGLPTDADDVATWLRDNTSGSNSADEAVFVGVGDMLRTGYVPAGVARAAIEVLGRLPEVRTETTGSQVKVIFDDPGTRDGNHYVIFDTDTADVIEEGFAGSEVSYRATTTYHPLADAVPADVLAEAVDPEQQQVAKPTS